MLLKAGYQQLGMDHFALPDDELTKAATAGRLERNFMGYTTPKHSLLIGLGASSISDAGLGYAQNISNVEQYKAAIEIGNLPLQKGHWLTPEEVKIRGWINDLMCNFSTS
jgi:oxygen-independent coproporphyrinogen-3 oxidase